MSKFTEEQTAVITCDDPIITTVAGAGCGKTYTAENFAIRKLQQDRGERGLFMVYNASVRNELRARFKAHAQSGVLRGVDVKTSHGLAFGEIGHQYADKLVADIGLADVERCLSRELEGFDSDSRFVYGHFLATYLKQWLCTARTQIDLDFVEQVTDERTKKIGVSFEDTVEHLNKLWARMIDPADRTVGMLHDGYLKLYQMSEPRLRYGFIILDEAQDTNPVVAAILRHANQADTTRLLVGDPNQSLYSWRGASNAMAMFGEDECTRFSLTESWRFGRNVEMLANEVLRIKESDLRLKGRATLPPKEVIEDIDAYTFIAAKNSGIFRYAAALSEHTKTFYVGGIEGYRVDRLSKLYDFSRGIKVDDPVFRLYGDFDELQGQSQSIGDVETLAMAGLVKQYGKKLPKVISKIRGCATKDASEADVVFTTGHKSKGLEWPVVKLADDFISPLDEDGQVVEYEPAKEESWNNLYVAMTRGQYKVDPPASFRKYQMMRRQGKVPKLRPPKRSPAYKP